MQTQLYPEAVGSTVGQGIPDSPCMGTVLHLVSLDLGELCKGKLHKTLCDQESGQTERPIQLTLDRWPNNMVIIPQGHITPKDHSSGFLLASVSGA